MAQDAEVEHYGPLHADIISIRIDPYLISLQAGLLVFFPVNSTTVTGMGFLPSLGSENGIPGSSAMSVHSED